MCYKVIFVPRKQLTLADCLSRNPIKDESVSGKEFSEVIDHHVRFITNHLPVTESLLQRIKDEQERDYVCAKLKEFYLGKWPTNDRLPDRLPAYYQLKNSISFSNGFFMLDIRLIISPPLQRLLSKIHEGHLGINKCRDKVKQSI